MRHRLLVLSLLVAVPLTIIVESAEAKCLTIDEAANACRYPQGDAWCREKFSDGRRYAYRDNCQSSTQTASSQPAPPPPAPSRVAAPVTPKTPEQLKQEEIARLRAKVKSEQQQAQAERERREQEAQQQRAYAEQQAQQASQPPSDPCSHLYIGKVFEARGGIFMMKMKYVVLGFSSSSGQATITSLPDDGVWRQEVSCRQIP